MKELTANSILALHALHLLMKKGKPASIAEIRRSSGFPAKQVESVLRKLSRAALIHAAPGRGFVLGRAPGEIRLQEMIVAIDEPRPPTAPCGGDFDACATRASCILAPLCRNAEAGFQETLRSFTLAELMDVPVDLPNCLDPKLRVEAS